MLAKPLVTCDGVRDEQTDLNPVTERAVHEICSVALHEWPNVLPIIHPTHQHQARMMRHALTKIRTPLVLYVEHDCPLVGDIPWSDLSVPLLRVGRT